MGEPGHLSRLRAGCSSVEFENLYQQIREIAARQLRSERPDHTLQATALVHEAFLRLSPTSDLARDRTRFLAFIARAMREVLVDYARARGARKRGAGALRISLEEAHNVLYQNVDVEALHEALNRLAILDGRQGAIVEMRFFGGMTVPEVAEALQISEKTVKRDWAMARAWLSGELLPR
jgi:RNA polymerase sigma factor (TIGR02999 family)